jgi:hypothetical protein
MQSVTVETNAGNGSEETILLVGCGFYFYDSSFPLSLNHLC